VDEPPAVFADRVDLASTTSKVCFKHYPGNLTKLLMS
jgi:hypothetical protein